MFQLSHLDDGDKNKYRWYTNIEEVLWGPTWCTAIKCQAHKKYKITVSFIGVCYNVAVEQCQTNISFQTIRDVRSYEEKMAPDSWSTGASRLKWEVHMDFASVSLTSRFPW